MNRGIEMSNYVFAYIRYGSSESDFFKQVSILEKYNCNRRLYEEIGDIKSERPILKYLKEELLRPGDVVVVESVSILGRDSKKLFGLVDYFEKNNINLISAREKIDIESA